MALVRFDEALQIAAKATKSNKLPDDKEVRIIRDVYGRIRFALNCAADQYPSEARAELEAQQKSLGAFATSEKLIFRDDFSDPDFVFQSPDWHVTTVAQKEPEEGTPLPDIVVLLMDRQISGHDWLRLPPVQNDHPHRFVFFGLKGGVGRSTALGMAAWALARRGKRVLLLDFDLESPGLSGLLLPDERVAEFGLVDWFIEDAVGQGESVVTSMVSTSPLSATTTAAIRVVAAMGQSEQDYLAKLARAYADVPGPSGPLRMGSRMRRVVELLEAQEAPDVVLIDSRSGLHDLAAVSITGLADTALLFATDSPQNWQGYRQLFRHWQQRPEVGARVRERLAFIRALLPTTDRERSVRVFHERAYSLFAETLYDDLKPIGDGLLLPSGANNELYHPAMADEAAPHFPVLVDWDERFLEFDPMLRSRLGGVTEAQVEATFGALIAWIVARLSEPLQ